MTTRRQSGLSVLSGLAGINTQERERSGYGWEQPTQATQPTLGGGDPVSSVREQTHYAAGKTSKGSKREQLQGPHNPIAPPGIISDAMAPTLLGMSSRSFKEAVKRQGIPHVRLGVRVLVMVADLARLANANASAGNVEPAKAIVPSFQSVDDVLAQLGRRRTA